MMMNIHRNRKTYQYEDYWITEGSCYLPLAGEKSSAIRNLLANPPFGVIWKVTHKRERYARVDVKTPFWVHRFLFTPVHLPFEHPPQYTLFIPLPLLRVGIQVNLKSLAAHFAWTLRRRQKSSPGTRIPPSYATNKVKSASGRIVREDSRSCINALEYEWQSRYQIAWISDITRVSNWAEEVNNSTTVWNSG